MKTFTVEVYGIKMAVVQDDDGKFITPDGWDGIGTALKPAHEPIVLARKPLSEGTIAANVLKWRCGALNIDACRIAHVTVEGGNLAQNTHLRATIKGQSDSWFKQGDGERFTSPHATGRWPANIITDGSEEVIGAFPESKSRGEYTESLSHPETKKQIFGSEIGSHKRENNYANEIGSAARYFKQCNWSASEIEEVGRRAERQHSRNRSSSANSLDRQDSESMVGPAVGSNSRFFYTAKANTDDRLGSKHPTVKPVDLMRWLCRLVTPPGGTILDPFAGTGTTGEAAFYEGFNAVLIEREPEYCTDIEHRMAACLAGPDERSRIANRNKQEPADILPMFATLGERG